MWAKSGSNVITFDEGLSHGLAIPENHWKESDYDGILDIRSLPCRPGREHVCQVGVLVARLEHEYETWYTVKYVPVNFSKVYSSELKHKQCIYAHVLLSFLVHFYLLDFVISLLDELLIFFQLWL
jgi:hypothetical protein